MCGKCSTVIERGRKYAYCSNCFACSGCEIYYCPKCNSEIVITPIRQPGEKKSGRVK